MGQVISVGGCESGVGRVGGEGERHGVHDLWHMEWNQHPLDHIRRRWRNSTQPSA